MKKIINTAESLVQEMLHGIALAHPTLELLEKYKVIKNRAIDQGKVSLISGGGSGHEPAHAGFVGPGMLDAAVCGDIFASPSQVQIYQAIKNVATPQGVLLIVKNYSGDIMNFQSAAQLAREDGIEVESIKVDDDVAVEDSLYTVGRRGVAGTVFVHKIAGAAAQSGLPLAEVKRVAEKAASLIRTIGFALNSCTVPAKGSPTFSLEEGEIEYGVGIHGEPGIRREALQSADALAARMVQTLLKELKPEASQRVAVLINGFGATPLMELYLLNNAVTRELTARGVAIARAFVGNYMTSIDMAGASLSLFKLDNEMEAFLDAPCDAPAFHVGGPAAAPSCGAYSTVDAAAKAPCFGIETDAAYASIGECFTLANAIYAVDAMSACIIRNEVPFCELDAHAGDGDFGMSVAKGFKQLKREWKGIVAQPGLDIGGFLNACSLVIMEHCGGASGPIWGSAFRAASKAAAGKEALSIAEFAAMLQAAVKGIQATGERAFGRGAVPGDKTLIDAFVPCADAWTQSAQNAASWADAFRVGAEAAVSGAKATESIVARMGRAGAVGERSLGYPDAGAHALGVIFSEIAEKLQLN